MFHVNRGGDHRQTYNYNGAGATIKVFSFLFIIGLVGGIGWAFVTTLDKVTTGIGRTWSTANNDTLINKVGGTFNTIMLIVTIGIMLAVVGPWIIRNWSQALASSPRARGDDWRVLPGDNPKLGEPGPVEPQFGLLVDGQHEESFIDADYERIGNDLCANNSQN